MRKIGKRRPPELSELANGNLLAEGARFNEALAAFGTSTFIPKGVYRFASHEAANQHQLDCLARGMAMLALKRLKKDE